MPVAREIVRDPHTSYSSWLNSPSPAEEAKVMLQGVGARFDFHMCKTLCDLRSVDKLGIYGADNWLSFFFLKGRGDLRYYSGLSGFEGGLARSQG